MRPAAQDIVLDPLASEGPSGQKPSGKRAVARCDALRIAPYSAHADKLYRGYLTPAHAAATNQTALWMQESGLNPRLDSLGNLIGRYEGDAPNQPALIIASHIDSVRNAGSYDGPLGIMLGIECIAALNAENKRLPFAIEVISFGDEEGSRFPISMICSGGIADQIKGDPLVLKDRDGVSVDEALKAFEDMVELEMPSGGIAAAARQKQDVMGYLEAHIEQGPHLDNKGLAVGAVLGIASQLRYEFQIKGRAGHAGTTAMNYRSDALVGAAEIIVLIEKITQQVGTDVVATVGQLHVNPGAVNVIPGLVTFSVDIRSLDQDLRNRTAQMIIEQARIRSENRGLTFSTEPLQDLAASPSDETLTTLLSEAIAATGQEPINLVSGAGHDAMMMSNLCPTTMLFIRCKDGISHNPAEHVEAADVETALSTMLEFIDLLGKTYAP